MIRKLTTTDAFVAIDIAGAPATGIVRAAPKILQGGASDLARSASYTFASFGIARSGASAGINVAADQAEAACRAFADELAEDAASGNLQLVAAKGTDADALAALGSPAATPAATLAGIVAATDWALGGLDGKRVAIEGSGEIVDGLTASLVGSGAEVVGIEGVDTKPWLVWGADVDAVLAGSKPGALNHQGAAMVKARTIVPWGPIPVTTKAFAALRRQGVNVLPDFVTANGALLAAHAEDPSPDAIARLVRSLLDELGNEGEGTLVNACLAAEAFLSTWTDQRLFGRPLSS